MALGGALGLGLVCRDAAALCVTGTAQTDVYRRVVWQVRYKHTSTLVLHGRRGTDGLGSAPGLGLVTRNAATGAAQTHIYHRVAWQAWHELTSTVVLRGRRGADGTG